MPNRIARNGWIPDYPDHRDYTLANNTRVRDMLARAGIPEDEDIAATRGLPEVVDLREWCSPVEHQETLGSCTAHAAVALVEFFQRRRFGTHLNASRLFLYKVTRNLAGTQGDCGATLRDTMKALVLFGVPPEEHWAYAPDDFNLEPEAFQYALAQNYQAEVYYRLDASGTSPQELLHCVKVHLAHEIPVMFGLSIYSAMYDVGQDGLIPRPSPTEPPAGEHAIVAVGYDDRIEIPHPVNETTTTGALLIRNSWGTDWGMEGYGWLPYDYVLWNLTSDWWALLKSEWVDPDNAERR